MWLLDVGRLDLDVGPLDQARCGPPRSGGPWFVLFRHALFWVFLWPERELECLVGPVAADGSCQNISQTTASFFKKLWTVMFRWSSIAGPPHVAVIASPVRQ